jgi:hypothetical protein
MAEDRGAHSELMVYLWYPTKHPKHEVKGILFPGAKQFDTSPNLARIRAKSSEAAGRWLFPA